MEHVQGPAHAAFNGGDEELLLRAEEPEDVRLGDPDRSRDRIGRAAVEPMCRELDERRFEDLVPPLGRRLAFAHCHDGA